MANENKTNGTSTPLEKVSEKASAPSPSKLSTTKQSDPPEEAPSKSPPPPLAPPPHSPPPPSPSPSPPPPQAQHPPPQAQHPPPQAQHPPPQAQHPPPHSSPPPSKFSPPHSESSPPPTPPSESSTPPTPPSESSTPPTPPSSPSSSPPSPPPPSDADSPPSQSNSPPSPQVPSAPSPSSQISPPLQNDPSLPQSASISPSSHSKPSFSPSNSDSLSKSSSSHDNTGQYIGFAVAGIFVLAVMAIIFVIVIKRKDKRGNFHGMPPPKKSQMKGDVHYYVESPGFGYNHMNNGGSIHPLRSPSEATPPQMSGGQILFSYDQILEITNGFSSENVIGEGGFGRVYKALMPDGRVGALKLLKAGSGQGEREFRAEVDTISRVHHRHLVSLIGYCIAEQQRVLIYEFVPNGNLDQHLHESQWNVLDWPKRMKIAIGAARGLAYLHEGCNPKIIHRDIKSSNILLDDSYEAQVADFGLARLTDDTNTHVSTRVMGTFGYMAPEYATSGKLTDRSDVFSFGVVLLELVTGRKPVDPTQPVGDESLVEWARPILLRAIETGDFSELADPRLHRQYIDSEMFRMIEAAAACIRHSAPKRPRMVQDLDPLLLQYGVASAGIIIFRERNNSRGLCLNLTVPTTAAVEIARALDSGDQLYDLSNGVKFGQSTVYDSGQYNEDIMRFKRMANGSFADSEFDMYSSEYSSRETSGSALVPKS